MPTERGETKQSGQLGLPLALAVAGLLMAGAATPLLAADRLSSCCDVGKTCDGGLFSCGSSSGCYCNLDYKCAQ
jgi:hypothetical protein